MRDQSKRILKTIFNMAGLDVRLRSRVAEAKRRQRRQEMLERWRFLTNYEIRTVVDVGANVGQFALQMREVLPEAGILSFEPLRSCFQELERCMGNRSHSRCFNVALGAEVGRAIMHNNNFSASSSLLNMAELHKLEAPHTADSTPEEVEMTTLDNALAGQVLEREILLKLDVQGYEDRVILGGKKTLESVRVAVIEVSCYPLCEDAPLFATVHDMMCDQGYLYRGNVDQWVSGLDGRILAVDAVFERG